MSLATQRLVDWATLRIGLLFCYEGEVHHYGRGDRGISEATAWLVERGWAKVTDDTGVPVRAKAGQWLFPRPGSRRQEFSANVRLLSLNFRCAFHTGENLFCDGLSLVADGRRHPQLEHRARALLRTAVRLMGRELVRRATRAPITLPGYLELQRALLNWVTVWSEALIDSGVRPMTVFTADPRVGEALAFIQDHLRESGLSVSQVAAAVGLSPSQLTRHFLRERGATVGQAIQRQRREYANHLLMYSRHSIKEIATMLGFRHPIALHRLVSQPSRSYPLSVSGQPNCQPVFSPRSVPRQSPLAAQRDCSQAAIAGPIAAAGC